MEDKVAYDLKYEFSLDELYVEKPIITVEDEFSKDELGIRDILFEDKDEAYELLNK